MHLTLPHPHRSPERKRRPVQARAIQHSRRQLLQLADNLETTGEPVNDRGVELVEQLLRDGSSPVYAALGDEALDEAVRQARAALH